MGECKDSPAGLCVILGHQLLQREEVGRSQICRAAYGKNGNGNSPKTFLEGGGGDGVEDDERTLMTFCTCEEHQ